MIRTSSLPSSGWRRGLLAGAALSTAVVLSACGGGGSSSDSAGGGMTMAPSSAPSGTAMFNDADVTFAQSMIAHHRQAIEMAAMADGRAASSDVKTLASKIKEAQQPEIDTMNGWLTAWGKPMPMPGMSSAMPGMDHSSMPGMMSDTDMAKLMNAKGAAFDKQFLTMMISHHEGAIQMAQLESTQGANPDAVELAKKIVTDQQAEITTMKGLLAAL